MMKGRQMKLKISLSQIPRLPPLRGDNIIPDPLVGMVEDGEKYSVTFDLKKDCTTTQKFIKIMKKVSNGHDLVICDYNFYPTNVHFENMARTNQYLRAYLIQVLDLGQ